MYVANIANIFNLTLSDVMNLSWDARHLRFHSHIRTDDTLVHSQVRAFHVYLLYFVYCVTVNTVAAAALHKTGVFY
jgi:hypothetical protein